MHPEQVIGILSRGNPQTLSHPVRVLDLSEITQQAGKIKAANPNFKMHVAVKACSAPGVLEILIREGASFEIASSGERRLVEQAYENLHGAKPDRNWVKQNISDTHPEKSSKQIEESLDAGIRTFVFQEFSDVEKFNKILESKGINKSEIHLMIRIKSAPENDVGSDLTTFDERFGVSPDKAKEMMDMCYDFGINNVGIAFHTGTEQHDVAAFEYPIQVASELRKYAKEKGHDLSDLDIGGGLPAQSEDYAKYNHIITKFLQQNGFDNNLVIFEPGRSISSAAGTTFGIIEAVNDKGTRVKSSAGKYNAGIYGVGHRYSAYRLVGDDVLSVTGEDRAVSVGGAACASFDTYDAMLTKGAKEGDILVVEGTGSYTGNMATHWCSPEALTTLIIPELATDQDKLAIMRMADNWLKRGAMKAGYYIFDGECNPQFLSHHDSSRTSDSSSQTVVVPHSEAASRLAGNDIQLQQTQS
jgi:ornithine decarboxylase